MDESVYRASKMLDRVYITTNRIELGQYDDIFWSICLKHSAHWSRNQEIPHPPLSVSFDFGGCYDKPDTPRESFFEHVAKIAQNTPVIPFTMTQAINLEDPVAGEDVFLKPDETAAAALRALHDNLWDEKWIGYIYHESGSFIDAAPLFWTRWEEEGVAIVKDINQTGFEISGWINQIVISEIVDQSWVVLQTFDLKS